MAHVPPADAEWGRDGSCCCFQKGSAENWKKPTGGQLLSDDTLRLLTELTDVMSQKIK